MRKLNQKGIVHILAVLTFIILGAGLVAGLYLVQKTQIFKPRAAEVKTSITESKPDPAIKSLTEQLLELDKQYDQDPSVFSLTPKDTSQIEKMVDLAKKRKELLLKKLEEGKPEDFLVNANLVEERDRLPEQVKVYIEEKVQSQGKLTIIHGDNFTDKKSTYDYFLKVNSNYSDNNYTLHPTKTLPMNFSGSEVKIHGVALDREIVIQMDNSTAEIQILSIPTVLPNIGEQKTAVLLVNTLGSPAQPYTNSQIYDLIFNTSNPNSVNNYYKEASYGKTFLTGGVFGWYSIVYGGCDPSIISSLARSEAKLAGVNIENYHRMVYILAGGVTNCFPLKGGFSTGGGDPSESWIIVVTESIIAHEFGHELGLMHANNIICQPGKITPATCGEGEYGDAHDVMGISYHQFNAPHKVGLGWIPDSNIKTVSSDGTFTISPLESVTTNTQVLQVAKPDADSSYFISYRQNGGFFDQDLDRDFSNSIRQGVSIHTWKNNSFETTKFIEHQGSFYGSTILDGETFQDQINDFQIKQISHDINGVTLQLSFGTLPDLVIPEIPSLNSGGIVAGANISFKASVKNMSAGAKAANFKNTFEIDTNSSSFTTTDVSLGNPMVVSLEPGSTVQIISDMWNTIPSGTHTLRVCVNRPKQIIEKDDSDTNNCKLLTFTVPVVSSNAKRVFVTSTTYNGDLKTQANDLPGIIVSDGLTGGDKICKYLADNSTNHNVLGKTWKAWLSGSGVVATWAKSRLTHHDGSYILVNGVPIANNWTDLTDDLLFNSINVTEDGNTIPILGDAWDVWTNSNPRGESSKWYPEETCNYWTSSSTIQKGYGGSTTKSDYEWTTSLNLGFQAHKCNNTAHLYCFEEPVVVVKTPPCEIYGDLNLDGKVTKDDADIVSKIVSGEQPTGNSSTSGDNQYMRIVGDVTGDQNITSEDALRIRKYVDGSEPTFPVCTNAKLPPANCNNLGDVTTDGKITPMDALEALRINLAYKDSIYTKKPYTDEQKKRADVDLEKNSLGESVSSVDSLRILRYINGTDTTFPGCIASPPPQGVGITTHYRMSDDLNVLTTLSWKEYTKDSMVVDYEFSDKTPGAKFIWVEFKDNTGRIERKNIQINLESSTPASSASPQPSISPTPVSTTPAASTGSIYTVSYRISSDPSSLSSSPKLPYTYPLILDYEFLDKTPGTKFIWVEFEDNTGKTERRNIQVELISLSVQPPVQTKPVIQENVQDNQENAGSDAF